MSAGLQAASEGDPHALRLFVREARGFVSFLRDHIVKEDECLADIVNSAFSPEERGSLTRQFEEMERREVGERVFERFSAMAARARHEGRRDPLRSSKALTPRTTLAKPGAAVQDRPEC